MKNTKLTLFLIFMFALFLRVGFIIFYDHGKMLKNINYAGDEYSYDQISMNLLAGRGFVIDEGLYARRTPVYPLFLAVIYFIFGHSFVIARFIQALLGSLSCIVIYYVARGFFDRDTGLIAAFISAVDYYLIQQPAYLLTEVLFTFLLAATIYNIHKLLTDFKFTRLAITAFLLTISILCRDSLIAFPFIICVLFVLDKRYELKIKIGRAALFILLVIFMMAPWAYRNFLIYRAFIPTSIGTGVTLYCGNNLLATGGTGGEWIGGIDSILPPDIKNVYSPETDRILKKKVFKFVVDNPGRFVFLVYRKFINMWRPFHADARIINKVIMSFTYIPLMILGLIGIILSLKLWPKERLLYSVIFYFTFIHIITIAEIRHRYPIMPYIIIFAAYALITMWRRKRYV